MIKPSRKPKLPLVTVFITVTEKETNIENGTRELAITVTNLTALFWGGL